MTRPSGLLVLSLAVIVSKEVETSQLDLGVTGQGLNSSSLGKYDRIVTVMNRVGELPSSTCSISQSCDLSVWNLSV